MKTFAQRRPERSGFTLVELLVSIGLTMFIMTIIVEAFTLSMDSFQGFRSVGDITTQVRGTLALLRNDLSQNHFEGNRRASDANFWDDARREGFIAIKQGSAPGAGNRSYADEGADLDGVNRSYLAKDHVLHFSNRLNGNRRDQIVFDVVPAQAAALATTQTTIMNVDREATFGRDAVNTVSSQWCEVAYFLVPIAGASNTIYDPNPPAHGPIVLHNLYRTQLLVFPFTDKVNALNLTFDNNILKNISRKASANSKFQFLSPNDLAKGASGRSFDLNPATFDTTRASLVCTNVVSFQVRLLKSTEPGFKDLPNAATFDTAQRQDYRLMGVQIILRVFDPASGLTRQGTLIQDL